MRRGYGQPLLATIIMPRAAAPRRWVLSTPPVALSQPRWETEPQPAAIIQLPLDKTRQPVERIPLAADMEISPVSHFRKLWERALRLPTSVHSVGGLRQRLEHSPPWLAERTR